MNVTILQQFSDLDQDQQRDAAAIWHDGLPPSDYIYDLDGTRIIGRIPLAQLARQGDGWDIQKYEALPKPIKSAVAKLPPQTPQLPPPVRSAMKRPKPLTLKQIRRELEFPGPRRRKRSALAQLITISLAAWIYHEQQRRSPA